MAIASIDLCSCARRSRVDAPRRDGYNRAVSALDGRVCLVTGASSGIGLETAVGLASRGASVAIVGRNPERLSAALAAVRAVAPQRGVYAFRADFSSLGEVRRLAEEVRATLPRLDVLVNNAGLWHQRRTMSRDGFEDTFAVNHLAAFLLTQLLLPWMLEDADGRRLVHVSSRLHEAAGQHAGLVGQARHIVELAGIRLGGAKARLDLTDVQCARGYDGLAAYARSKLAQILFSNELARRLAPERVTSNALHPGSVNTSVVRDNRFLTWGIRVVAPLLKSASEGAATSIYVASDAALTGVSGRYYSDSAEAAPAPVVFDRDAALELWDLSTKMVGLSASAV